MVITIGRQHGSNGHLVAKALSERLGIPCFDKEIVDYAAENSEYSKEIFNTYDEKRVNHFMVSSPHYVGMNEGFRLNMNIASAQFDAIRALANTGDCIFVGRCADYVLRQRSDLISVFILGDLDARVNILCERKGLDKAAATRLLKEVDKDRSSYYKYYTDQIWGEAENYDLCIDSLKIGVEGTVDVIEAYIKACK